MADALDREFHIEGHVSILAGMNDMPKVVLRHGSGAGAEVYLHGAHITSWKTADGEELIFLSRESYFEPGKPIRGGIPVIFPQFSGQGPLPQHGLARTREWQLLKTELLDNGVVTAEFGITDNAESMEVWPHQFALRLRVLLDEDALTVAMHAVNRGTRDFDFQTALHTYFQVADIGRAAVEGLAGTMFIDSLRDRVREQETRAAVRFDQETDRIYVSTPDELRLDDEGDGRIITIEKRNMPDVVVWNPWIEKSERMPDFGDDEYQRMVCVETGSIETKPRLASGDAWQGETTFRCCR